MIDSISGAGCPRQPGARLSPADFAVWTVLGCSCPRTWPNRERRREGLHPRDAERPRRRSTTMARAGLRSHSSSHELQDGMEIEWRAREIRGHLQAFPFRRHAGVVPAGSRGRCPRARLLMEVRSHRYVEVRLRHHRGRGEWALLRQLARSSARLPALGRLVPQTARATTPTRATKKPRLTDALRGAGKRDLNSRKTWKNPNEFGGLFAKPARPFKSLSLSFRFVPLRTDRFRRGTAHKQHMNRSGQVPRVGSTTRPRVILLEGASSRPLRPNPRRPLLQTLWSVR